MSRARSITFLGAAIGASILALSCELLIDTSKLDDGQALTTDGASPSDQASPLGDGTTPPKDGSIIVADAACAGDAGPSMVRVGNFCIDSTEVTNTDYETFLAAHPSTSLAPPSCSWKANFDHNGTWAPVNPGGGSPAGNVDWCDAFVYCKWAGKRLCGDPRGGSTAFSSYADPVADEWYFACSDGGTLAFPCGNALAEHACNGRLADGGFQDGGPAYQVEATGSAPACVGGFSGIFDMSGNIAEWEDCCDDTTGGDAAAQKCRMRGGSANSDVAQLRCDDPASFGPYARSSVTDDLGFRCCSP